LRIVKEFHITIRKNVVFKLLDCRSDSPIYDLVEKTYEELLKTVYSYIEPKSFILYAKPGKGETGLLGKYGREFLYIVTTIGEKLETRSMNCFGEGKYLEAMLLDAMADDYLFQMEEALTGILKEEAAKRGKGIKQRIEAPDDIPIEFHKTVFEKIDKAERQNIKMTAGYMFEPVKTCCYVLALSENKDLFKCRHDCGKCQMFDCKLRTTSYNNESFIGRGEDLKLSSDPISKIEPLGIAIDIGTTTIAIALVGLGTGMVYGYDSRLNSQRSYGADVISRIQASNNGVGEALRKEIITDLMEGIRAVVIEKNIKTNMVKRLVISANTTMCHLLMGYDCKGLGTYPFKPANVKLVNASFSEVFLMDYMEAEVLILPGISAFVGADIVSGLFLCGFHKLKEPALFIDLGTNGEMAIGNKDHIISTSTAAGPAFEGGNISCGIGSITGAISSVTIDNHQVTYETIGNKKPLGLCGSGVLSIAAELLDKQIMDETGLLDTKFLDKGYFITAAENGLDIVFTQKDIREIQLAKAAVRAGIEVLLKRYKCDYKNIKTVYLAGGLGFHIDIEKAVKIGLIPEELKGKVIVAGNTSLKGAISCLLESENISAAKDLIHRAEEISLGNDPDFNDIYMNAMFFGRNELIIPF